MMAALQRCAISLFAREISSSRISVRGSRTKSQQLAPPPPGLTPRHARARIQSGTVDANGNINGKHYKLELAHDAPIDKLLKSLHEWAVRPKPRQVPASEPSSDLLKYDDFVALQLSMANLVHQGKTDAALELVYSALRARRAKSSLSTTENWQFCIVFLPLITFYFDQDNTTKALAIFESLEKEGVTPDLHIYNSILDGFTRGKDPSLLRAFQYFDLMKKRGIEPDTASYNIIIKQINHEGKFPLAMKYFDEMKSAKIPANKVTFNLILTSYSKMKNTTEMVSLFNDMVANGKADAATYTTMISAFLAEHRLEEAKKYLGSLRASNSNLDPYAYNRLVPAFVEAGGLLVAMELHGEMVQKNIRTSRASISALINALIRSDLKSRDRLMMKLYREAISRGIRFGTPFNSMVVNYFAPKDIGFVFEILESMKRVHDEPTLFIYHVIFKNLPKDDQLLQTAKSLFADLKSTGLVPEDRTYNSMINIAILANDDTFVMEMLEEMQAAGVKPNLVTHNIILRSFTEKKDWNRTFKFLEKMRSDGLEPNVVTYNTITHALAGNHELDAAKKFFEEMRRLGITPNHVTYNTFISAFAMEGQVDTAVQFFDTMRASGIQADHVAYTVVIGALLSVDRFTEAAGLLEEMKSAGVSNDARLLMKFVQYYIKKNDLAKALELFEGMQRDGMKGDVPLYTLLITQLATDEALQNPTYTNGNPLIFRLFNEMRYFKVKRTEGIYREVYNALVKLGQADRAAKVRSDAEADGISVAHPSP